MNLENIALFDMDGTLADFEGQMLKDLKKVQLPNEEDFLDLHSDDIPQPIYNRMSLIKKQTGWWKNLPRIPLGFDILKICTEIGFVPHILTKGPKTTTNAWSEKLEWCVENGLLNSVGSGITITLDKGLVYGKVLVDDYPEYMLSWLKWRPRGLGIMPIHKYNKDFSHPNVVMCDQNNLEKVKSALQKAFDRKPREL